MIRCLHGNLQMTKKFAIFKTSSNDRIKIDAEDLKKVEKYSWRVTVGTTGRRRVVASLPTKKGYVTTTLGKFLMKPPRGKQVYPRRFNQELDYRKSNLIICTLKERQRLLPKKKTPHSSSYRGVSFSRASQKWRAGIQVNGKSINLGEFKKEKDAANAYNLAAKQHFGKIAYQNPIGSAGRRLRKD